MIKVTIVLPAFNAENYIERALHSALNQSERSLEVLVIDDGSSDSTADRVLSLAALDERLRLIVLERNRGNCVARNFGIAEARGEWIANLDADDWYAQDRLERMLSAVRIEPADIVADNIAFIAEGARQSWQTLLPESGPEIFRIDAEDYIIGDMRRGERSLGLIHPIIRRSFLETHKLRYRPDVRTGGDSEFILRCLSKTPDILVLREPRYFYVVRTGSVSRTRSAEQLEQLKPYFEDMISHFGHNLSMQRLLRERVRRLEQYIRIKKIVDPARSGNWAKAFFILIRDLAILPGFLQFSFYRIWILVRRLVNSGLCQLAIHRR